MLACDHGNRPSQVLDYKYRGIETEGGTGERETGMVHNVKTTTTTTTQRAARIER